MQSESPASGIPIRNGVAYVDQAYQDIVFWELLRKPEVKQVYVDAQTITLQGGESALEVANRVWEQTHDDKRKPMPHHAPVVVGGSASAQLEHTVKAAGHRFTKQKFDDYAAHPDFSRPGVLGAA